MSNNTPTPVNDAGVREMAVGEQVAVEAEHVAIETAVRMAEDLVGISRTSTET